MAAAAAALPPEDGFAGAGRAGLVRVALFALQLATSLAFARLLSPAHCGQVAMVSAFGAFLVLGASLGLPTVLVQREDLGDRDLSAALGLSLAAGLALGGGYALAAPVVARFYGEPGLGALVRLQGAAVLAWAAGNVPRTLLARRRQVGLLLRQELAATALAALVCLPLAAGGVGAAALASFGLVSGTGSTLLAFRAARLRVRPAWDGASARVLLAAGLPLTALAGLTYWSQNLDNLLIGKLAGGRELGLYSRAYQMMFQPLWALAGLVSAYLVPSLARLQDQQEKARSLYLDGQALLAALALPVLLGGAAASADLVPVLLGPQWSPMVPMLVLLLLAGVVQVPMMLVGPACAAHGRNALLLRWGMVSAPATMAGLAVGACWRTGFSVAVGFLVANLGLAVPTVRLAQGVLGFRLGEVARALAPALGSALAMSALVLATARALEGWSRPSRLALCLLVGAASYAGLGRVLGVRLPSFAREPS